MFAAPDQQHTGAPFAGGTTSVSSASWEPEASRPPDIWIRRRPPQQLCWEELQLGDLEEEHHALGGAFPPPGKPLPLWAQAGLRGSRAGGPGLELGANCWIFLGNALRRPDFRGGGCQGSRTVGLDLTGGVLKKFKQGSI